MEILQIFRMRIKFSIRSVKEPEQKSTRISLLQFGRQTHQGFGVGGGSRHQVVEGQGGSLLFGLSVWKEYFSVG